MKIIIDTKEDREELDKIAELLKTLKRSSVPVAPEAGAEAYTMFDMPVLGAKPPEDEDGKQLRKKISDEDYEVTTY